MFPIQRYGKNDITWDEYEHLMRRAWDICPNSHTLWPVTNRYKEFKNGIVYYCTTFTSTYTNYEAESVIIEVYAKQSKIDINILLRSNIAPVRMTVFLQDHIGHTLLPGENLVRLHGIDYDDYDFVTQLLRFHLDIGFIHFYTHLEETVRRLASPTDTSLVIENKSNWVNRLFFSESLKMKGYIASIFSIPVADVAKFIHKKDEIPQARRITPREIKP